MFAAITSPGLTDSPELKRFKELEGKYHYMGETHSGCEHLMQVNGNQSGIVAKAEPS